MKISILLPYKENFGSTNAGAVSLFVNDITRKSFYKKTTKIFGNTLYKTFLPKNYVNLTFDNNLFLSSNNQYVKEFLNYKEALNSDLVEVHNRPNYINIIRTKYQNRLYLYFHNNPLQMNGSKTIKERMDLLNNVDKIIFNSEWTKSKFFVDLDNIQNLTRKTHVCFQSSSKIKINFKKKKI